MVALGPRPEDTLIDISPPQAPSRKDLGATLRCASVDAALSAANDAVWASAAVVLAITWAARTGDDVPSLWLTALFVPLVIILLAARSMYRRSITRSFLDEIGPVETAVALASLIVLTVVTFGEVTDQPGEFVSKVWICAGAMLPVARLIRVVVERRLRDRSLDLSPTLILGNGRVAHQITQRLNSSPKFGMTPVGMLSNDPPWTGSDIPAGAPWLGSPEDIGYAIETTRAEAIIIAFSRMPDQQLTEIVRMAQERGLRVWVVPRMFDMVGERARVEHIGGLPLLALPHTNPRGWQFTLKHIGGSVCAAAALIALSPLFAVIAALIRLSSPGPVFFRQTRVGRDGQVFDCLKFRTMREPLPGDPEFRPSDGSAPGGVEGVDRRTTIGRLLRRTSLDELPQLINVVRGEMSIIGPRPERPEFVALYESKIGRYSDRHRVKAGITGWAQVHGLRGQTSIIDRAEYDNYYIENWSIALDFKILALTVLAVLRRAE
jgi:exopolysaccharide biosynthesis polyprenyl glycosylphosphotransferase